MFRFYDNLILFNLLLVYNLPTFLRVEIQNCSVSPKAKDVYLYQVFPVYKVKLYRIVDVVLNSKFM